MGTIAEEIFPNSNLPAWDAIECFRLFMVHRRGNPTPQERNDFAQQVTQKVCLSVAQHQFMKVLNQGSGADEVINRIVAFICSRTDRFHLRVPWESLSPDAGSRAMISSLNTCVFRKMIEEIEGTKRERAQKLANAGNSAEAMDLIPSRAMVDDGDLQRLVDHMIAEETIDRICMRVPGDIFAIEDVVTEQLGTLNGQELRSYFDLRPDLRKKISPEIHAICTARIVREIEEFTSMVE